MPYELQQEAFLITLTGLSATLLFHVVNCVSSSALATYPSPTGSGRGESWSTHLVRDVPPTLQERAVAFLLLLTTAWKALTVYCYRALFFVAASLCFLTAYNPTAKPPVPRGLYSRAFLLFLFVCFCLFVCGVVLCFVAVLPKSSCLPLLRLDQASHIPFSLASVPAEAHCLLPMKYCDLPHYVPIVSCRCNKIAKCNPVFQPPALKVDCTPSPHSPATECKEATQYAHTRHTARRGKL